MLLYASDFARYLADNALADNATNRGKFFIEKTVGGPPGAIGGLWSDIYLSGSKRENENAMPATETFS